MSAIIPDQFSRVQYYFQYSIFFNSQKEKNRICGSLRFVFLWYATASRGWAGRSDLRFDLSWLGETRMVAAIISG